MNKSYKILKFCNLFYKKAHGEYEMEEAFPLEPHFAHSVVRLFEKVAEKMGIDIDTSTIFNEVMGAVMDQADVNIVKAALSELVKKYLGESTIIKDVFDMYLDSGAMGDVSDYEYDEDDSEVHERMPPKDIDFNELIKFINEKISDLDVDHGLIPEIAESQENTFEEPGRPANSYQEPTEEDKMYDLEDSWDTPQEMHDRSRWFNPKERSDTSGERHGRGYGRGKNQFKGMKSPLSPEKW